MKWIIGFGMVLACLMGSGCATVSQQRSMLDSGVSLHPGGLVRFQGEIVDPERLSLYLRREGVRSGEPVRVRLEDEPDPAAMKALIVTLRQAGFPRVLFVRPRRASSAPGDS